MEAPLRIWVSPDDMGPREPVDWSRPFAELGPIGCEGETEYIRADLVPQWQPDAANRIEALEAENAALRAALLDMADCGNWPVFAHRIVRGKAFAALAARQRGMGDGQSD